VSDLYIFLQYSQYYHIYIGLFESYNDSDVKGNNNYSTLNLT